jgi:hypothetical protein
MTIFPIWGRRKRIEADQRGEGSGEMDRFRLRDTRCERNISIEEKAVFSILSFCIRKVNPGYTLLSDFVLTML